MRKLTDYRIHILYPLSVLFLMVGAGVAVASSENSGPEAVADGLHDALAKGDVARVHELLDPNVLIFESGGVESSLEEYATHHMHSDMAFLAELEHDLQVREVFEAGDLAVVSSQSRLTGLFRDQEVDISSTETLIIERTQDGWKVSHIHWSSRPNDR